METCRKCRIEQPDGAFYARNGKLDLSWCRACYRAWHQENREQRVAAIAAATKKRYNRHTVTFECQQCGTCVARTVGDNGYAKFCTRQCKDRFGKDKAIADRLLSKTERPCVHCGASVATSMRSDAKFCSAACNDAAHAITRKMAQRVGRAKNPGDPLLQRNYIAERDKFRCGICGCRVDMKLKHPDPMFGSIDHIVPLAAGGSNGLANLQLTHLRCNLSKRDQGGPAQLRLLG